MANFTGTAGNDDLPGTEADDDFDLSQGGDDIARGLGGTDLFRFGAMFDEQDAVFGGGGTDALWLEGQYLLDLGATNFVGMEQLALFGAFDYVIDFKDSALPAGKVLEITSTVSSGHDVTINAEREADAVFHVFTGASNDVILTGDGDDIVRTSHGIDTIAPGRGHDTVNGGDGNDDFLFSTGEFDAKDRIDGGDTTLVNTINLDGDYSAGLTLGRHTFVNINQIAILGGHDYVIDLGKLVVPVANLTIDADVLGSKDTLSFDASHTHGGAAFTMYGGAGEDVFVGAGGVDFFVGGMDGDTITGGNGDDTFYFNVVAESTRRHYDTIVGFDTREDLFMFDFQAMSDFQINGINAEVTAGALSTESFENDLIAAIGAAQLGPSHAVLFTPNGGTLAGKTFLIVDANGVDGYQSGLDFVMNLEAANHLSELTENDFAVFV